MLNTFDVRADVARELTSSKSSMNFILILTILMILTRHLFTIKFYKKRRNDSLDDN